MKNSKNKNSYVIKKGDEYYVGEAAKEVIWTLRTTDACSFPIIKEAFILAEELEGVLIKKFSDGFEKPIVNFQHP